MDREIIRKKLALLREEKRKASSEEPVWLSEDASLISFGGFQLLRSHGPITDIDVTEGDPAEAPKFLRYEACFLGDWRSGEECAYRLIAGITTENKRGLSFVNSCVGTISVDSVEELVSQLFKVARELKPHPLLSANFEQQNLFWDVRTSAMKGSWNDVLRLASEDVTTPSNVSPQIAQWYDLCESDVPRLHEFFYPAVQLMRDKPVYERGRPEGELEKKDSDYRSRVTSSFSAGVKRLGGLASFQSQKRGRCPQCSTLGGASALNAGSSGYNLCVHCFSAYFNFSASGNYHGSDDDYDDFERRMLVDSIVEVKMKYLYKIKQVLAGDGYRSGSFPNYPSVGDEIMRLYFAGMVLSWDFFIESSD